MNIFKRLAEVRTLSSTIHDPAYLALAICGESGELANLIKKRWAGYQVVSDDAIKKELADVLNYCFHMVITLGMTFEEIDKVCIEKLEAFKRKTQA